MKLSPKSFDFCKPFNLALLLLTLVTMPTFGIGRRLRGGRRISSPDNTKVRYIQFKCVSFTLTFYDACPCCDASSCASSRPYSYSCSSSVCSSCSSTCSLVCSRLGSAHVTGFEPSWRRKSEPNTGCCFFVQTI